MFDFEKRKRPVVSFSQRITMVGILLVAAWLRWMQPGLVEFKYDEAHIFGMARGIASGQFWPALSGGTSIGLPRSALDAYILAIPLALTDGSPQAAVIWLGMLGVFAVALSYLLGRMIHGPWTGALAATYMAVNPWLAYYDRKFWAHIQVIFSVMLLLLAWRVVVRNNRRAAFWFPVIAALQLLTHVLALVQALSWIGAIIVAPKRWRRRVTLLGVLSGFLLMVPYIAALGQRALQAGPRAATLGGKVLAVSGETGGQSLLERWRLAWLLAGGDHIFELTGMGKRITVWDELSAWVFWLVVGFMIIGLARVAWWLREPDRRLGAGLLLAWTLGPALALSLGPLQVYLQYWTALLPLPALYFALGVTWLPHLAGRFAQNGEENAISPLQIVVMALMACLMMGIWSGAWMSVLARIDAGAGLQTFGRPLRDWQAGVAQANAWADELGLEQVKVLARGVDPGQDGEPAAIASLIGNPPYARFLDLNGPTPGLLLHLNQPSLYLTTSNEMDALLSSLGELVWQSDETTPMRLYLLPPGPEAGISVQILAQPGEFDVGAALTAYAFPDPWPANKPAQVILVWRMTQPTDQARQGDYTAFNHIVRTGTDQKVAQVDGMAMLSRDWWPDDVLYQFYTITIPESGEFQWLAGLYSRTDGHRARLLSGGDAVHLPLKAVVR